MKFSYWNRYKRLLGNSLPPLVLGQLDGDTDDIVGLLQDPSRQGAWKRRGLGMGDVQSGKTGNYIGVACKAADYGYKFIVLLAGMHNNLRTQTQERVEEGFIGPDPNEGVGFLDPTVETVSLTTRTSDFKREIADAATISFDSVKVPIVLVVKKQKRVLENLIAWVQSKNRTGGGVIRGVPMLLLDDEADNASVNTRADGSPTQINALIRQLLAQF